jgi:cysteate synthase
LNITGGGYERLKSELPIYKIKPALSVSGPDVPLDDILRVIEWPTLSKTL